MSNRRLATNAAGCDRALARSTSRRRIGGTGGRRGTARRAVARSVGAVGAGAVRWAVGAAWAHDRGSVAVVDARREPHRLRRDRPRRPPAPASARSAWAFVVTGVLGGFTTFSSFAVEVDDLFDADRFGLGALATSAVTLIGGYVGHVRSQQGTADHIVTPVLFVAAASLGALAASRRPPAAAELCRRCSSSTSSAAGCSAS